MSGEAWLYLFAVLINAVNLFLQVFFTIMYSDLEWSVMPLFPALHQWQTSSRRATCAQAGPRWRLPRPRRADEFATAATTSTRSISATA